MDGNIIGTNALFVLKMPLPGMALTHTVYRQGRVKFGFAPGFFAKK
jgi:hypothetical protein